MTDSVPKDQLKKLPYLQHIPDDGRIVSLQSYYDHETSDWHLWLPVRPGELGRIAGGEVVTGSYYAVAPADPSRDVELPLGTLLTMRLSFAPALLQFGKLENDVHRCAAVLEKYHLFSAMRGDKSTHASLLVVSELEYLLMLLRSLYDVLQGVVGAVATKLIHLDGTERRVTRQLPSSFADVALLGEEFRALDEMESRWGIPAALGRWYQYEAQFFRELRELRDGISHQGRSPPTVYSLDWGFAITPSEPPWNRFDEWPVDRLWDGRLGSLRSIFAGFIVHSLQACTRFASVLDSIVQLPPPLHDGLRFYLRSPFGHRLVKLEDMRKQPWEGLDGEKVVLAG
ncbi:MAG: hypothetical protein HYS61_02325 [Acidobacteria bacterium]|nr:hypothetical protein [Acidobacteriota bacterium]